MPPSCSARWPASIRATRRPTPAVARRRPTTRRASTPDGLQGRAHRRRAEAVLRLQRRRPIALIDAGDRRHEGAGRGHRRSRRHPDGSTSRTTASSRCCSTSSRPDLNDVPGGARPVGAGALARRPHRLQRAAEGRARCRSSGRRSLLPAQKKGPLTSPAYRGRSRRAGAARAPEGIDAVMTRAQARRARRAHRQPGVADRPRERRSLPRRAARTPAAVAGYPSITVPAGFARGLPVGLSFIGRAWSERDLIRSPTPTSRPRNTGAHRRFRRRFRSLSAAVVMVRTSGC